MAKKPSMEDAMKLAFTEGVDAGFKEAIGIALEVLEKMGEGHIVIPMAELLHDARKIQLQKCRASIGAK